MITYLLLGLAGLIWTYWYWSVRDLLRFAANYPKLQEIPIIGVICKLRDANSLLSIVSSAFDELQTLTYFSWVGLQGTLCTADPDLLRKVLQSPEMLNKVKGYSAVKRLIGDGILTRKDTEWQDHRRKINPSFKHKIIVSLLPMFHKGRNTMYAILETMADNGHEYLLEDTLRRIMLAITIETVLGKNIKEGVVDEKISRMYRDALEIGVLQIITSYVNLDWIFSYSKKYMNATTSIASFVNRILKDRLESTKCDRENSEKDESALIPKGDTHDIFINQALKLYGQNKFSLNDIVIESNTLVTAAFETSAITVFSCLCMLAMHPQIQQQLFEEIKSVFPNKNFTMDPEDIDKLPYLNMVLNETMRLYPAVPLIARQAVKDTLLDNGLRLPKGLQVLVSIYDLHRRPEWWGPTPHKFDPDHFLPDRIKERPPDSFLPFSKGSRNCIGWHYALYSMKVMLAGLVRNYRFETSTKPGDLKVFMNIVLRIQNSPELKVFRRN